MSALMHYCAFAFHRLDNVRLLKALQTNQFGDKESIRVFIKCDCICIF